ncbi:MAG: LacI family DNA-binding transcriptional regulator [Anaerolineae bacterium]|nr:LacI family DNA-binding transcriptional regulator [Anaerolineae bacterium]
MNNKGMVTQQDVARRAGVSRSVVSYVLNNGPRQVSEDTRLRVLKAIQELGYRPNEHAQRLKMGSDAARNSIGVVTGGKSYNILQRPYFNLILSGLFDSAYQYDQQIRFFVFWEALKDPVFFNKSIHQDEISSLILILPSFIVAQPEEEQLLLEVIERVDNVICLEESVLGLPAVIFDRAAAARLAVEHLINLGHQRIAFLAITDQRLMGYRQSLLEHHLPYDETLVRSVDPTHPARSAYDITNYFLDLDDRTTAIFAANDESAMARWRPFRIAGCASRMIFPSYQ